MGPRSLRRSILLLLFAGAIALSSCAVPLNLTDPAGPRYVGCAAPAIEPEAIDPALGGEARGPSADVLRVVTFNIKLAEAIDPAIMLLGHAAELRTADLLLLQEMDAQGVRRIADARGMCYVYYPATVHPATGRYFGPAILSRWPLREDRKLVLPHRARFNREARIAVTATVEVRGQPIRIYSVHVATRMELSPSSRRDQIRTLLADADGSYPRVIIGGDLNWHELGRLFVEHGYAWPTQDLGWTARFGDVDHIFVRGLALRPGVSVGKVRDNLDSSDHDPVWVELAL